MPRVVRLALSGFLLMSSAAFATSVEKFSLRDLASKSRSVVVARVTSSESRWDGGEIYTYTTIRVSEGLKGARKGQTIVVRQIGGQVGDLASIVPGMPSFKSGEEVVLFLSANDKAGHPWVMGLEQGKYTIASDNSGKKRVRRNTSELNLVDRGSDVTGALPEEAPLDLFLNEVRQELGIPLNAIPSEGAN
jgi:hypothetical protein